MDLEQLVQQFNAQTWMLDGNCAADCERPDDFYPVSRSSDYHETSARAKEFCNGGSGYFKCPVRARCLVYALRLDEEHGIYGGLSRRERNALVRKWRSLDPDIDFSSEDDALLPAAEVMLSARDRL